MPSELQLTVSYRLTLKWHPHTLNFAEQPLLWKVPVELVVFHLFHLAHDCWSSFNNSSSVTLLPLTFQQIISESTVWIQKWWSHLVDFIGQEPSWYVSSHYSRGSYTYSSLSWTMSLRKPWSLRSSLYSFMATGDNHVKGCPLCLRVNYRCDSHDLRIFSCWAKPGHDQLTFRN